MLLSNQTNKVYFSALLKSDYSQLFQRIKSTLEEHGIGVDVLHETKDYWCRDYMPIQVDKNTFVKYTYNPDYLQNPNKRQYITNSDKPWAHLGLDGARVVDMTDIVLDGGNVVKTPYHVIMTEKIFKENLNISHDELIKKLETAFQTEVLIVPWFNEEEDICGHTDGMVRYVKNKELILDNYSKYDPIAGGKLQTIFKQHGYTVHELPLPHTVDSSWAYINFLQTANVIVVPGLNLKTDEIACEFLQSLYDVPVVQIPAPNIIGTYGGAFNCLSWNIIV